MLNFLIQLKGRHAFQARISGGAHPARGRRAALAGDLDDTYLDRRIRTETGGVASLETLRKWLADEPRQA
jgi:hypothetical protein